MTSTTTPHSDDREALCALFDDELHGDAARFAYRRLEHDAAWRETVGRWQLSGDVLRQQAQGVAPAGFGARVALALEDERAAPALLVGTGTGGGSVARGARRWIPGAALAASVAVAALFVVRPGDEPVSPASGLASQGPSDRPAVAAAEVPGVLPGVESERADAAVVASTGGRVAGRERVEAPGSRIEDPAPPAVAPSAGTVAPATAERVIADAGTPIPEDPFQAPRMDAGEQARPWPKAVLPGYGDRGFTVDYGQAAPASFYPFDPRVHDEADPPPSSTPVEPPPRTH